MFLEGLLQAQQGVEAVIEFARGHPGADLGRAIDESLVAQQRQGLAHGVAGGAVLGGELLLTGQGALHRARQDLVAQDVGHPARPIGTLATDRCGCRFLADLHEQRR